MMDHNLIAKAKINNVSLSFNEATLEAAFKKHAFPQALVQARVAIIFGVLMFVIFGYFDKVFMPKGLSVNVFRFEMLIAVLGITTLIFSFTRYFLDYYQVIIGFLCAVVGLLLVAKLTFVPIDSLNYYFPSMLIFMFQKPNFMF